MIDKVEMAAGKEAIKAADLVARAKAVLEMNG